ncbi:hypothetical protein Sste5346_003911 [Sporothrix stenoceras]|uniref:Uncharacterized protein n=1 Tax=Sporothrix stenoceras TaxID=5173 RepID=A0ABR3ZBC7_9PEZI
MASSTTRVALVTAGSAGLGAAVARVLAERAAELVAQLRREAERGAAAGGPDAGADERPPRRRHQQPRVGAHDRLSDLEQDVVEDDWHRCFDVNVKAHLWLFYAAKSALDASEGVFAYDVTKAAQIHLIKSLAVIAAPKIRVNCVSPGILMTDWGRSFPQEKLDSVRETNKLKVFATVEDVARHVLCFVESRTVTGQNAVIDAGFSL